jgi:hypothetical protein
MSLSTDCEPGSRALLPTPVVVKRRSHTRKRNVSKSKIFVETSVTNSIGTRNLSDADWRDVVLYLAPKFDFVVSPLTFLEILNSLARGDERFVLPNRKRLYALFPLNPLKPTFLEMPGQFVRRYVLGYDRLLVTYQPDQLREALINILECEGIPEELRLFLREVEAMHRRGLEDFSTKYQEARRIGQRRPNRADWVRSNFELLGVADPSDKQVEAAGLALDAAYEFSAWTRKRLADARYSPEADKSSWVDGQQLFYLCDPDMHMLYLDGDFIERTGSSSQRSRLLKLTTVMGEAHAESMDIEG